MGYNGGRLGRVTFADDFLGADEPPFFGNHWNAQLTDASSFAGVTLSGNLNRGGGFGLITANPANLTCRTLFTPADLDRVRVCNLTVTRPSFSRFTIVGFAAGISCSTGLMVMNPNPNSDNCYLLLFQSSLGNMEIWRGVGNSAVSLATGLSSFANNDVFEFVCTPSPSQNALQIIKNGVVVSTFNDNNALRPTFGVFGMHYFSGNLGSLSFKNWSGGVR